MIAATQFFNDTGGGADCSEGDHRDSEKQDDGDTSSKSFSKWHQVSSHAWRLLDQKDDAVTGVSPLQRDSGNSQPVLDSMDRFLAQQQQQQHQPSITSNSKKPASGCIAGLNISDPRDQWVHDMQTFLKDTHEGTIKKNNSEASVTNSSNFYSDRQGIAVSAPLRLTAKTLSKSMLTIKTRKESDQSTAAVIGNVQNDNVQKDSPTAHFCLDALKSRGSACTIIDFSSSQTSDEALSKDNAYVPEGYEDFEDHRRESEEKKKEPVKPPPVYFMTEIQNCSSSKHTILEDIACIWGDLNTKMDPDGGSTYSSNLSAQGIQLKIISCSTWKDILDQQSQRGDDPDLTWILTELEQASPLCLPQAVGAGWGKDESAAKVPSIMILLSFDPRDTHDKQSSQTGKERLLAKLQKRIDEGNFAMKFQCHEVVQHPLLSSISVSRFAIGRKFQVGHHQASEEAKVLEALQASMLNAEKFIPARLKQRWDTFPDALVSIFPHPLLPPNLSRWLLDPMMKRSDFDPSLGNVMPIMCQYIDKTMIVGQLEYDVSCITHGVKERVAVVQQSAALNGEGGRLKGCGVDANALFCTTFAGRANDDGATSTACGYIERMQEALQIERFRCFEDMKKHDMYSINWKAHTVEIAPPTHSSQDCPRCNSGTQKSLLCAYHFAARTVEAETGRTPHNGKPIAIRTRKQLEQFPLLLSKMRPEDCVVVKVHVPGVAEDYPLISMGDFARLLFSTPSTPGGDPLTTEVIAEVADVVIKKEEVTLRLPSPLQTRSGYPVSSMACLPYFQSLLHTNDYVLDAVLILRAFTTTQIIPFLEAQVINENTKNWFRFSIRFNFQGGRGFDIIRRVLGSTVADLGFPKKLKKCSKKEKRCRAHLCRVLVPTIARLDGVTHINDRAEKLPPEDLLNFENPLNLHQKRAVGDIVNSLHGSAPYIIEGPAGTGKTMVVCEAIIQVFRAYGGKCDKTILVCAPSDAACDVLASRLLPHLPKESLLRINWWSRKLASVKPELLSSCPMSETGGMFIIPGVDKLREARVIVCQCFVAECLELAGPTGWTRNCVSHVFIDETSQAMECEALVPLLKLSDECSIVLAGDTKQLSSSIRSPVAASMGLGLSIQERLLQLPLYRYGDYCTITRLVNNYRSNEALLVVPSNLFYGGLLQADAPEEVANPFENLGDMGQAGFPLLLCDVSQGKEHNKLDTPSFYNLAECDAIVSLVRGLLRCKTKEGVTPLHTGEISVITPFRAQVLALRVVLRAANLGGVNVGVVADFQGQEFKVVFISTVLTRDHQRWNQSDSADSSDGVAGNATGAQQLGFLHDPKSFNVAITRAHALCVIVGHGDYLDSSGTYWSALIQHIRNNDGVLGEEDDGENEDGGDGPNEDDPYGIADLMKRVEALQLLGSGAEEDRHDLSYYYSDVPQWKVMLS